MAGRLEGKRAIITGAGSGLGLAMTERFAAEGARILAVDRSGTEEQLADRLGESVEAVHLDVSIEEEVRRLGDVARERFGGIDVVCNNAGVGGGKRLHVHEYPMADFDRVMAVNVRGAYLVLQESLRVMLESGGGSIVNTSSLGGFRALPGSSAYAISKAAVIMMTRQAGLEYATRGIRINAICPGVIDTPLVQRRGPEIVEGLRASVPMGRLGLPQEVANVTLFLASDEASYVTGQCWLIDGGKTA